MCRVMSCLTLPPRKWSHQKTDQLIRRCHPYSRNFCLTRGNYPNIMRKSDRQVVTFSHFPASKAEPSWLAIDLLTLRSWFVFSPSRRTTLVYTLDRPHNMQHSMARRWRRQRRRRQEKRLLLVGEEQGPREAWHRARHGSVWPCSSTTPPLAPPRAFSWVAVRCSVWGGGRRKVRPGLRR